MLAANQSHLTASATATQKGWDRARLSVVAPISVIVVVAIVCIVVAVLTSAQRADEVALNHDKSLLTRSITNHGERILRELESVAVTDQAVHSIRNEFDQDWIQLRVGLWLKNFFDHDFVFVADAKGDFVYALLGRTSVDPRWFNSILPELAPTIDYVRGRAGASPDRAIRITEFARADQLTATRVALVQQFLGRPAIVAAVPVVPPDSVEEGERQTAPIVLSVKFIDDEVLAEIANRLQLKNLRKVGAEQISPGDHSVDLADDNNNMIARFAWTPKRPGAEIVRSVIPFIAVALAGFALLAGLIFGYMRRTTATIAASENSLRYLALHDPLCGLPNRNYFGERLQAVIREVQRGGPSAAVFYIDLDHFKDVNDTLGHPVGDELIRNVTFRLSGTLRSDDLVARLGGDEFAVISSLGTDTTTLQSTANRIISALCAPYSISGHNIVIGASIGIATIDKRSDGAAADIMRYADMALYRAKNEGRNRACIYDAAMDADLSHRKLLEHDLRLAIEQDNLTLQYQPIVNASGEKILGVEALCRWIHPERGAIEPAKFIPIAEHSGLIIELGEWVLRRACAEAREWPDITVAVNVSPLQFRRLDFVDVVERILEQTDLDPHRLELELTESTLLGNVETAEIAMHRLKAIGVKLALDDFGTGYSSLAYLRRFPFDKLKIDRSFVRSIERAPDAAAIVHAIVGLGRGLGMKVTAEGVETAEQQLFLRAAGVHCMQGYRFGKPGSPTLISARLAVPGAWRSIEGDAAALAG
ncbi:MAG TPA: EAL domain-containing protein [Pseudorhodoplanes sp.]|nr:EAL domain-containing protein [Pseudorhodoplanes sp.]